jgi:hypothetical protein
MYQADKGRRNCPIPNQDNYRRGFVQGRIEDKDGQEGVVSVWMRGNMIATTTSKSQRRANNVQSCQVFDRIPVVSMPADLSSNNIPPSNNVPRYREIFK